MNACASFLPPARRALAARLLAPVRSWGSAPVGRSRPADRHTQQHLTPGSQGSNISRSEIALRSQGASRRSTGTLGRRRDRTAPRDCGEPRVIGPCCAGDGACGQGALPSNVGGGGSARSRLRLACIANGCAKVGCGRRQRWHARLFLRIGPTAPAITIIGAAPPARRWHGAPPSRRRQLPDLRNTFRGRPAVGQRWQDGDRGMA